MLFRSYIGVVWTGYETPSTMHVNGNPAAKIWKQVMEEIHKDLPYKDFITPMHIEIPGPKLPDIPEEITESPNPENIYPEENFPAGFEEFERPDIIIINPNIPEQPIEPKPEEEIQTPIVIQPEPVPDKIPEPVPEPVPKPVPEPEPNIQPGQIIDPWTLLPVQ